MSLELGFHLHFQDEFRDFVREEIMGDYLRPILPYASYYPDECDFIWAGENYHNFNCLRERYMFENFFDLYHVQMYTLLSKFYSLRLRQLAEDTYQALRRRFAKASTEDDDFEFVGVHVRHEFQYSDRKQDDRKARNLTINDYYVLMDNLEVKFRSTPKIKRFIYLAIGDSSIKEFRPTNRILIESFLQEHYPYLTRLQIIMVSVDILSRCKLRIVSQFGNNFILHMAFHRLNNNIFDVKIGDVFSQRIYSYFGDELEDLGRFNILNYFGQDYYNPYLMSLNKWSHEYAIKCFKKYLFAELDLKERFPSDTACLERFKNEEIGGANRKFKALPKKYPNKKGDMVEAIF
jgi:hypothetical protein